MQEKAPEVIIDLGQRHLNFYVKIEGEEEFEQSEESIIHILVNLISQFFYDAIWRLV